MRHRPIFFCVAFDERLRGIIDKSAEARRDNSYSHSRCVENMANVDVLEKPKSTCRSSPALRMSASLRRQAAGMMLDEKPMSS